MSRKSFVKLLLSVAALVVVVTLYLGLAKTQQYSAYSACRRLAMTTKGYAVWTHERTIPMVFTSQVVFSDGFNDLVCDAIGIGPFWTVRMATHTLVGCVKNLDTGETCPEDYFGVNP